MSEHPISSKKLLDMDATAVLQAYRDGVLKPSEAVEIYIAHQKRFNKVLNAVVEDRYAEARKEAAHYDALLAEGRIEGKLFGVPMSMKEAFDVAGMHTTGCVKHLKDRIRETDADAVKRLRDEGAIILDKTNTPTLCFCQETDNYLFGRSDNPWDPLCTTGGSSGGEAALIAVGGAAAGFGSDIGGSIRIPSHFNGVIGFKAGAFQFSDEGSFPPVTVEHQRQMLGFGPIVKSVRDAALIYSIIHPLFQPPSAWEIPSDLKAISFGSFHKTQCTSETEQVLRQAQEVLRKAGAKLNNDVPDFMIDVALAWQLIMSEDRGKGVADYAYPNQPKGFYADWARAKLGLKAQNHPYLSWAIIGTNLFAPNSKRIDWITRFLKKGAEQIEKLLGSKGVFIIPTYPSPAKRHGRIYAEIFGINRSFRWVLPFIALPNVFGLPSIVVPCGWSADGMPIGLQVASTVGNEQLIFKAAAFLESAFGGYRRSTLHD